MDNSYEQKNFQKDLKLSQLLSLPATITKVATTKFNISVTLPTTTNSELTKSITISTNNIFSEKPFEYPDVGPCHFSVFYQTIFNGERLIKRVLVKKLENIYNY